jgi:hypothetical protein
MTLLTEPEPQRPHKSGGSRDRKAPRARHYPVYIAAYTEYYLPKMGIV